MDDVGLIAFGEDSAFDDAVLTRVSIATIQGGASLDSGDDDEDCFPSPLVGTKVVTSGIVTGRTENGFYIQDGLGPYSGIWVHTGREPIVKSCVKKSAYISHTYPVVSALLPL